MEKVVESKAVKKVNKFFEKGSERTDKIRKTKSDIVNEKIINISETVYTEKNQTDVMKCMLGPGRHSTLKDINTDAEVQNTGHRILGRRTESKQTESKNKKHDERLGTETRRQRVLELGFASPYYQRHTRNESGGHTESKSKTTHDRSEKLLENESQLNDIRKLNTCTVEPFPERKPIIKTVTSDDTKVYKAVTFYNVKNKPPLDIKLQQEESFGRIPVDTKSKATVTEEKHNRKHGKRTKSKKRQKNSQDLYGDEEEAVKVVEWDPKSVNQLTKPYYEAWVDTTLAVVTKKTRNSDLDKEKQMHMLKEAFEKASGTFNATVNVDEIEKGTITVRRR